jgi:glycosyltransferase involved in cell wall biosynthesis
MKINIAILASNFIKLPPNSHDVPHGYSGAPEKIMHTITEELVKRNHNITLFASGDSQTSAKLVAVTQKATALDPEIDILHHEEFEHLLIAKCYEMAKKNVFDVIHTIFDIKSSYYAPLVSTPTVSTLHSPLVGIRKKILSQNPNSQYYVSISNSQRKPIPNLKYAGTIYHGIYPDKYHFSENGKHEYILYTGRLIAEKGIDLIVSVAKKCSKKTYLLGTPDPNSEYWNNNIQSFIDNILLFHKGFVEEKHLIQYYQQAKLFLFPIQWEEPFGLVMIESMATGTPVVAFARGSVPEIVKDGETGFIVNSSENDTRGNWIIKKTRIDGLCEAVERIYSMPQEEYRQMRKACRAHVEKNFTVEKMVDEYERVYQNILNS